MIRIENDCVGCPDYCHHCGLKNTPHYYCDRCDCEDEYLYRSDNGEEVCADCLEEEYLEGLEDYKEERRIERGE